MKKSSVAMKTNIHISNKMVKKFSSFLTTTLFIYFRKKEMTSNCKWYFKTSDLATVNKWVVIKTTTLNKFVSFPPKNGSCNLSVRPETDFPVEFDKIIHHTIFGDLNIV